MGAKALEKSQKDRSPWQMCLRPCRTSHASQEAPERGGRQRPMAPGFEWRAPGDTTIFLSNEHNTKTLGDTSVTWGSTRNPTEPPRDDGALLARLRPASRSSSLFAPCKDRLLRAQWVPERESRLEMGGV